VNSFWIAYIISFKFLIYQKEYGGKNWINYPNQRKYRKYMQNGYIRHFAIYWNDNRYCFSNKRWIIRGNK